MARHEQLTVTNLEVTGYVFHYRAAPTAKTVDATLTAAEVLGGMITSAQGAAGTATYTLPTGTQLSTASPIAPKVGDCFDFTVVNISTNAAEDAIIAGATGTTLVGDARVASIDAAGTNASSGQFRFRCTGANTWSVYRIN